MIRKRLGAGERAGVEIGRMTRWSRRAQRMRALVSCVPAAACLLAATGAPRSDRVHGSSPLERCDPAAPCPVDGHHRFEALSAGFDHTCGITTGGDAFCWGDGRHGALGDGGTAVRMAPVRVRDVPRLVEIHAGGDYTCGRTDEGDVYCWGKSYPVPGQPKISAVPAKVPFDWPAIALTTGRRHACVLASDRRAYCWGFNADGEGGNGTSGIDASVIPLPSRVLGDLRWSAISAGLDYTCGLTTEGAAYCWGSNVDGVLGPAAPGRCGDVEPVPCAVAPVRINTSLSFAEIAAGSSHVCARTHARVVYCWGSNVQGQTGAPVAGAEGKILAPRRVEEPPRVGAFNAVVSGGSHSCALAARGQLYCWGLNASWQLGWRAGSQSTTPVWAQPLLTFMAVTAGEYHTCGITQRAAAYCWGNNDLGALGRK